MTDTKPLTVAWRSPSNIAIIKYWGKHGVQLPDNPSLSITLSEAFTETRLSARALIESASPGMTFRFHGEEKPAFANRIATYLNQISGIVPCVSRYHLSIDSENSFPHSSGIASSAASMSALALCIADLQNQSDGVTQLDMQKVSTLSRLGSGSACRSVYGPVSMWGETPMIPGASDDYAIPLPQVHAVFATLRDTILIIDEGTKAVSSSVGHGLMKGHPFAKARIAQASQHLKMLLPALHGGDFMTFARVAEAEALALHGLMMTSDPAYVLMQPNTLEVLQRITNYRKTTGTPVCFTLDAGPNVHVLFPSECREEVQSWIVDELSTFCKNGRMIEDYAGAGPVRMPGY